MTTLAHYDIRLYRLDSHGQRGACVLHEQGSGEPPPAISIDGFSRTLSIDLADYWTEIVERRLEHARARTSTYETIVKFGETSQLVNEYELLIETEFGNA